MEVVFFGNERLATAVSTSAPVLQTLVENGYKINAVIANHTDVVSRQKRDLEIGTIAHSFGIPVILPGKKIPLIDKVRRHITDVAVLVAFGQIIPQDVIDLFPKGIINVHPSLLPKLRGPTPIETAILDGLNETGVTLMKLVAKMDAGPIYAQQKVKLNGSESKSELAEKLGLVGSQLLAEHLDDILSGALKPKLQIDDEKTYARLIKKTDGLIDWNKSAARLEREIRAYAGWPGSRTELGGKDVIVTEAKADNDQRSADSVGKIINQSKQLAIQTGDGVLIIERLKPAGKREMSASEFIRGYL